MSYMKRYLDERLEELAENDPTMFCIYALEGVIRDYFCFDKDIFKDAE